MGPLNVPDCCLFWEQVNCSTFLLLNRSPLISINISPSIPSPPSKWNMWILTQFYPSCFSCIGSTDRQTDRQVIKLLFQMQAGRTNSKNKAKPQKGIIDKETAWEKDSKLLYDWLIGCPTEPFSLLPLYRFVASILQLLVEKDTERPKRLSCFQCWIHTFNTLMLVPVSWNAKDRFGCCPFKLWVMKW